MPVHPKVTAATLGVAAAAILIYLIESVAVVDLPTAVEGALVVLATFGAGWLTPSESPRDPNLRR
jgi:hypothetical protein